MNYLKFILLPTVFSLLFTPLVRKFALKNGLVSHPRADRWHKKPTAILGGGAIYLAAVISIFIFLPRDRNMLAILSGSTLLFAVGLIDDRFHITPYAKLFAQIVAACIAVFFGIIPALNVNPIFIIPLAILWIVGVTNSFNLLDNIDGLAAGVAFISSLLLFFSSLILSNNPLGIAALIIAGATLGFLPYNFNPAKIFMGDCGSMFLGYCLAVTALSGTTRHISNLFLALIVPVFILSVPIFDTLFVMIFRTIQGRKIFEGGKDHPSHHLVTLGLSQKKTVVLLYAFSAIFGAIALLYPRLNIYTILILVFLGIAILLVFGFFLFETSSLNAGKHGRKDSANRTFLSVILMHKRRIIEMLLDFIFICVAYYSAYFLRYEGSAFYTITYLINESLVWIIMIKMAVFFTFGLYRGVWKYISISDLLTIFKVISIASVASVLFLTFVFRFQEYSRTVFFIDWLLLLLLLSGSRMSFRLIGEFLSRAREKGNNVLIFGAGDTGEMVIREIKRNKSLNYNPIGFIDDDPVKEGNKIQGICVLGARDKIKDLAERYEVKEVLIAVPSMDIMDFAEVGRICQDCGITYRKIRGILDKEDLDVFRKN